jgi:hypothetical protein
MTTTTGGAVRRAVIPRPRVAVELQPAAQPELPGPRYPWPEPWGSFRGARPRSEYWDVVTASWHSRGPYPR